MKLSKPVSSGPEAQDFDVAAKLAQTASLKGQPTTAPAQPLVQTKQSASPSTPYAITVMRSTGPDTRKIFQLGADGDLSVTAFPLASKFYWRLEPVEGVKDLARLVQELSRDTKAILIRGAPMGNPANPSRRLKSNFAEPQSGCPWVMLDFDGITLPAGISPIEPVAIEALVRKLPAEFHQASYFYQFSSSSGVLKSNGEFRKPGVSAHLFFWLSRPVTGKDMEAWLRLHCMHTGGFAKKLDRGGVPRLQYDVDSSVLISAVQPHYVALPGIGAGVNCILKAEHRQGLVQKASAKVPVPDFEPRLQAEYADQHAKLSSQWKRECGYVRKTSMAKLPNGGVSVETYYGSRAGPSAATGRSFQRAAVTNAPARPTGRQQLGPVKFASLFFEGESTPGSWWVSSSRPTVARRFGDDETLDLRVLSEVAYAYVRDELKWFEEIVQRQLNLTAEGYLPAFDTFIRARNTLLLAPTGSGKTAAFCDYAFARRTHIIVYAAQTIALTHQMVQDLRARQVRAHHYGSFNEWLKDMEPGVYVTTNMSMKRFIGHLQKQGASFTLVIDEAHLGIDDFMRTEARSKELDTALARATNTILMTGTITELQIRKIAECIGHATGSLTSQNFEFCEFKPVRANQLRWVDEKKFGTDLIALMRSHQALKEAGQAIPRTVVIVPTSSMRVYELLLAHFGLTDEAMVVSRTEVLQEEIEAARVSAKPWLISSPLFAIGLNFENAPQRLWTSFGRLQVDKSQIVQTVNRANRSQVACEVRLYAGRTDPTPFPDPFLLHERATIEDYLQGEAEVQGDIDPRHQLDRLTYLRLREKSEQLTAKALYQLHEDDAIQNYQIVEVWDEDLVREPGDAALFKAMCRLASASYLEDVAVRHEFFFGENIALLLHYLEGTYERVRYIARNGEVPKDIEDDRRALLACITGNPKHIKTSEGPDAHTISRLFAVRRPFLSGQYSTDKTEAWRPALAEKVRAIVRVLQALEDLRDGKIDGVGFGWKMRQPSLRAGVLALAKNETDYLKWNRELAKLDEAFAARKKASAQARTKLNEIIFKSAREFLVRLGVEFNTKATGNTRRLDPTQPEVPAWNFAKMKLELEVLAESVEHRPVKDPDTELGAKKFDGVSVSKKLCATCVHCMASEQCALGFPIEFFEDGVDPVQDHCPSFKKLSVRVLRLKEQTIRQEI